MPSYTPSRYVHSTPIKHRRAPGARPAKVEWKTRTANALRAIRSIHTSDTFLRQHLDRAAEHLNFIGENATNREYQAAHKAASRELAIGFQTLVSKSEDLG